MQFFRTVSVTCALFYTVTINLSFRLCAGWIDVAAGWQWVMYFGALVQTASFIIIYFFMEETMYFRNTVEGVDEEDISDDSQTAQPNTDTSGEKEAGAETKVAGQITDVSAGTFMPKKTYRQKLALFRSMPGGPSVKQMFKMMYRPLIMMYHFPSVSWAGL